MRFQYHPEAARELSRSIEYYEEKSEGFGAKFLDEVEYGNRFPFEIIYEVSEELLTVIAIMHQRRHPDYWKSRK